MKISLNQQKMNYGYGMDATTDGKIAKFLQIDLSVAIQLIRNQQPLEVGNLFDGNRIRLKQSVILRNKVYKNAFNLSNFCTTMLNFVWWN